MIIYTNAVDYEKDKAKTLEALESQKMVFSILEKIIPNDGTPMRITNLFYDLLQHSKFNDDNSTSTPIKQDSENKNPLENMNFKQILIKKKNIK